MTNQAVTDTAHATRVTPAGWYQDPASAEKVRWWNGLAWTDHTEDKPDEAAQRAADARALEREFGISTAENAIMSGAGTAATATTTATTGSTATAAAAHHTPRASTGNVWLLAFMPVFALVVGLGAAYVYIYVAPTPLVALAVVLLWALGFLWAHNDARALRARGVDAPRPLWALVGALVYLVLRSTKVAGRRPLVVFGVLTLLAGGAIVAGAMSGATAPVRTALDVQFTLQHELVDSGKLTSVSCPAVIDSSKAGAVFTCSGTAADGSSRDVWVSFDDTSGHFSYAIDTRKG